MRRLWELLPGLFETFKEVEVMTFKSGFPIGRLLLLAHHFGVLLIVLFWARVAIWDWPKSLEIINQGSEYPHIGLDIIWPFIGHMFSRILDCLFLYLPLGMFFIFSAGLKSFFSFDLERSIFSNILEVGVTFFLLLSVWFFLLYVDYRILTNQFHFWGLWKMFVSNSEYVLEILLGIIKKWGIEG